MTTNMLKAISKMLEPAEPDTLEIRVACAKIMLDEVIKGMSGDFAAEVVIPHIVDTTIRPEAEPPKPKPPKPNPPDKPYRVVVNADRKITKIEGLDLDAPVTLDGKVMKHKDAIGKSFTKVSLP